MPQGRSLGGRDNLTVPDKTSLDLEALMQPETLPETLQLLAEQAGTSSNKLYDWICGKDPLFFDVNDRSFSRWAKEGNMPYAVAQQIELVVIGIAGGDKPFLTRHYQLQKES